MARISNSGGTSKNVLSSVWRAVKSLKTRQGTAHAVKQASTSRARKVNGLSPRRRLFNRTLFSRKARSPASSAERTNIKADFAGKDGTQSGKRLLEIFSTAAPEEILHAVHETAINPEIQQDHVLSYNGDLHVSFQQKLMSMNDQELLALYQKFNSSDMLNLRAGLKLAAQQGAGRGTASDGVKKEFDFTSRHLEGLNRIILAEVMLHRSLVDNLLPLRGQNMSRKTKNILRRFGRDMAPHISSSSGDVPKAILQRFQNDFAKLARQSEEGVADEAVGKEGGICHLDRQNPNSEELNVSEIYIKDFKRIPKKFDDGEQVITNHQLGWNEFDRKNISDHITQFCRGDANQARRVNSLLSQQSLADLYKLQRGGAFVPYPRAADQPHQFDGYEGNKNLSQTITRLANGDVRVRTMQTLEPNMFNRFKNHGGIEFLPVGDKKSVLRLDIDILVPAQRSVAPEITHFRHSSHIVVEDSIIEM